MDYTVIVRRPPNLCDGSFDLFFAHVVSDNVAQAQDQGVEEAWRSDQYDEGLERDMDSDEVYAELREYSIVAVFDGHLYDKSIT